MLVARSKNYKEVERLLKQFPVDTREKIIKRVLARAIQSGRVVVSKEIRADYNVAAAHVKQALSISQNNTSAFLKVKSHPRVLSYFDINPKEPTWEPGASVSAEIKTDNGRKTIPKAFVARMTSGHIGVFIHVGGRRISQLYGPSVTGMAKNPAVAAEFMERVDEVLEGRLLHEIDAVLKGYV
ncbi:hypothetical protein [Megamonas hypermegale]|uniref:hypothetical protein n=1 Tax=Megamonas hypermegale TaxID=158847 RepID=UPI0026F2499D|nr:hypothetical protein [Megamonas hypermegale]